MTYLDFEVKIDDLGGGRYRATVTDMPLGEGQAEVSNDFTLPYSEDDLKRILAVLSGQVETTTTERERQARSFGETLFKAVFGGQVYTVYFSSRDRARTEEGLRVKLFLENAGALANLPWEFLRDPAVDYLALSKSTPLIRHPRRLVIRPTPVFKRPLRVLVMISSPSDLPPVDEAAEWNNLQVATESLRKRGLIELEKLEDASLRTLQRVLRGGDYHVFHYIGHSSFDTATAQGMLALEDPYGENSSAPVRGEDLARELSEENDIRLVVLNSCQSAVDVRTDPFAGIASSLVARGMPAVIAMQTVIGDQAARVFSEELYRAVAEGLPIDAAMSEARRAISNTVPGIEWATPVLFMRTPDGMLFETGRRIVVQKARQHPAVWIALGGAVLLVILAIIGLLARSGNKKTPPARSVDVAITGVEISPPRPVLGEKSFIIIHVVNDSRANIGPFTYDFRQDVLDAEPIYTGKSRVTLVPGAETTLLVPHYFTWWGAYVPEVRLDVDNQLKETDEFNNTRRSPVVVADSPFSIDFGVLPSGDTIVQSMAVSADTFAAWGFHLEAIPTADPACAAVVPWIVVTPAAHVLSTGLPESPTICTDAGIALVLDRQAVGGVSIDFVAGQGAEYTLTAFDEEGEELDRLPQTFTTNAGNLELSGGFPSPLEISRAELSGVSGVPTQITRLAIFDPVRGGR